VPTDEFPDSLMAEMAERREESNLSLLRCILLGQAIVQFGFSVWWSLSDAGIPAPLRHSFNAFNIEVGFMLAMPYLFAVARSYGPRPVALAAAAGMACGMAGANLLLTLRGLLTAIIMPGIWPRNLILALTEAAVFGLSLRIAQQAGKKQKSLLWFGLSFAFLGAWYAVCVLLFIAQMKPWH